MTPTKLKCVYDRRIFAFDDSFLAFVLYQFSEKRACVFDMFKMHFRRANLASANAKLIFTTLLEISSLNPSHAPTENVCEFSDARSGSSNASICNTAFEGWKCTPLNRKLYISRFFTFVMPVSDPIRCIAKTLFQDATLEGGEMRLAHVQFAIVNSILCLNQTFTEFRFCTKCRQQMHFLQCRIWKLEQHQMFVLI